MEMAADLARKLLSVIPETVREELAITQNGPVNSNGSLLTTDGGFINLEEPRSEKNNAAILQEQVFDCPECLNRGYLLRIDENGNRYGRECSCMERRRSILRFRESGLENLLERYTFANYRTLKPWQEKAKAAAMRYAENPTDWFLACGSVGAGKTHLCTAICGEFLKRGMDVRYMLWREHATAAKAVANSAEEYEKIVEPMKRATVLYIDDLFKTGRGQAPTAADVNLAFEILNARYNDRQKLTLISTELDDVELLDVDTGVGSRIYERTQEPGHCLAFQGEDKNWRIYGG